MIAQEGLHLGAYWFAFPAGILALLVGCLLWMRFMQPSLDEKARKTDRDILFRSMVERAGNTHELRVAIRLHMSYDPAWERADEQTRQEGVTEALHYYRELRMKGVK